MKLSELSIQRPVFATVLNLMILLVGWVAWSKLPVRQVPKIDTPVVSVNTSYPGANAAVIESQITKPIEDALAGIEGVDFITSDSRAEQSNVNIVFRLDRDPDGAASDVRDRVNQARELLPFDAREPIVQKQEADAQPIIWLAFSSDRHQDVEVADIANRLVKDKLQSIPGVAQARLFASLYAMRIWLDPDRLGAFGVTSEDVEDALRGQNVEIPAGRIESTQREFTVLAQTDLSTPEQFADIILRDDNGYLVRLGDVARIELGKADERSRGRFNGKPAVPLGLVRTSTANPLDISKGLRAALPQITAQLPAGMKVDIAYDSTIFIDASLKSVFRTIFEAIALVALVIFVFLRSWRATLIPLVTIPVSLIGAAAIMYFADFSLNTLTLLAMVLAIGLVVDDAIVMLENIHRHIEEGQSPMQAALIGSKEIGFAIVAMTLTLAAVYLPISFSGGATGKLFIEFALTLAGAVIVSGFVALTLSPMMCSRLLRTQHARGGFYEMGEKVLKTLERTYRRMLDFVLHHRMLAVVPMVMISLGLIVWAGKKLPNELAPKEDPGFVLTFALGPQGATLDFMDQYATQIEKAYSEIPEVDRYFLFVGWPTLNSSISFPGLKDWSERKRSAEEVQGEMFGRFSQIPGIMAFPQVPAALGGDLFGQDLQFVVQTTASYEELARIQDQLVEKMRANPQLLNPRGNLEMNKPELRVSVNRDKVAALGADVAEVGRTLESFLGGRQVTRFKRGSEQYDVIVQVDKAARQTPEALTAIQVRVGDGSMVPLSNLVDVQEGAAAAELAHFNKLRSAQIGASLAPGYALGDAIGFMEQSLKEIAGEQATYELTGQSREFRALQSNTWTLLALALAFIFLVLAAQFESFIDPFIIIISVVFAFAGALLALILTEGSLNVYSKVGLITLIGLIAKHGILIVEFANQKRAAGLSLIEATREAAALRLRPILMTTGAMVLGAIPLAIATGAGAEARQQLGWVIVGGLLYGTLFTLLVVPAIYAMIKSRSNKSVA